MTGHWMRNAGAGPAGVCPEPVIGLGEDTPVPATQGASSLAHGCSSVGRETAVESVVLEPFHHVLHTHPLSAFDCRT